MDIKAYAKINIGLDVLSKRPDGYHNIASIMASISLCDYLSLEKSEAKRISCDKKGLPLDERNIIWKAISVLERHTGRNLPAKITLNKLIPIAAGLAGGSADGAATLKAMNELYQLGLSNKTLMDLGVEIGADVPFCLTRGIALAEGIGEKLSFLKAKPKAKILLVNPGIEISTAEAYKNVDYLNEERVDFTKLIAALDSWNVAELKIHAKNVMENYSFKKYPLLKEIKDNLYDKGAELALMSGSGATMFGLFSDEEALDRAKTYFELNYPSYRVIKTEFL